MAEIIQFKSEIQIQVDILKADLAAGTWVPTTHKEISGYFPSTLFDRVKCDRDSLRYLLDCLLEIASLNLAQTAIGEFSSYCLSLLEKMSWPLQPITMAGLPLLIHNRKFLIAQILNDKMGMAGLLATETPHEDLLGLNDPVTIEEILLEKEAQMRPVPRHIFCIWVGPRLAPFTVEVWREYSRLHGYEFTFFDERAIQPFLGGSANLFNDYISIGGFHGASNIARYSILEQLGGYYVDLDYVPAFMDFDVLACFESNGLTVFPEGRFRDLASGSCFFGNSLIFTPPQHPVIRRVRRTVGTSIQKIGLLPSWWSSGPCLFTRALFGTFQTSSFPFASAPVDARNSIELSDLLRSMRGQIQLPLVFCRPWSD